MSISLTHKHDFKIGFSENKEDISTIIVYIRQKMMKEFTPLGLNLLFQLPMLGLFHYAKKYVFTSSYSAQNAKTMLQWLQNR